MGWVHIARVEIESCNLEKHWFPLQANEAESLLILFRAPTNNQSHTESTRPPRYRPFLPSIARLSWHSPKSPLDRFLRFARASSH